MKFIDYVWFIKGMTMTQFNKLNKTDKNQIILEHKEYVKRIADYNKKFGGMDDERFY